MPVVTRQLSTAEERREAVLSAALREVAARGYKGARTLEVAKAAGISHAYLFRLFPTKTDLAVAIVGRVNDAIYETFAEAARTARAQGEDVLQAMGQAYKPLVTGRRELALCQLHAHAAAADEPEIRAAMQRSFADLIELVRRESGADPEAIRAFCAYGMLSNVLTALGAHGSDDDWARTLTGATA